MCYYFCNIIVGMWCEFDNFVEFEGYRFFFGLFGFFFEYVLVIIDNKVRRYIWDLNGF